MGDATRDEILATAILDRLPHDAEEAFTINGPSYRLRGCTEILTEQPQNGSAVQSDTTD